jgi:peptidoglycan/LPS O-acetylase OafA/YrhL
LTAPINKNLSLQPAPPNVLTTDHRRLPALDGLRGVAVLLIVGYHVGGGATFTFAPVHWFGEGLKQGWIGVLLFFVLSGFLITGILWDSRGEPHWIRNFYARRMLRILPLYYLALLLVLLGAVVTGTFREALARIWSPLLFLQDFPGLPTEYMRHNYSPLPIVHLWSLAVEEQFYLLWPFLLLLTKTTRSALYLCASIFMISASIGIAEAFIPAISLHVPLVVPHAAEIAAGAWLAIAYRTPLWYRLQQPARVIAPLALALFILSVLYPSLDAISPLAIALCFAALLILALQPGAIARLLSLGALCRLGTLSYGIYVYHVLLWPVFKFAARHIGGPTQGVLGQIIRVSVRLAITLLVSWVSFHYFERPFLRLKHRYPTAGPADIHPPHAQRFAPASIQPMT